MPGLPVNITTSSVPAEYCPSDLPSAWAFLVSLLQAELSGNNTTFNSGDTTPSPDNQDRPWFPPSPSGSNPPAFGYHFVDGAWIMWNPNPTGEVVMYQGTEASIETHDGGEAGTITETTGPMWQKVAALDGKMPIGPGTLPSGATIAVGGTGGAEEHTIARDELPNIQLSTESVRRNNVEESGTGAATVYVPDTTTGSFVVNTPLKTESLNGDVTQEPVSMLPPYVGIWFIVRTARKYYRR